MLHLVPNVERWTLYVERCTLYAAEKLKIIVGIILPLFYILII